MQIDETKSAQENVWALINDANGTAIDDTYGFTVGTPAVDGAGVGGRNTKLTLTAQDTSNWQGSMDVSYRRVGMLDNVPSPKPTSYAPVSRTATKSDILAAVVSLLKLVPSDVMIVEDMATFPTNITLRPIPNSLLYIGDSPYALTWPAPTGTGAWSFSAAVPRAYNADHHAPSTGTVTVNGKTWYSDGRYVYGYDVLTGNQVAEVDLIAANTAWVSPIWQSFFVDKAGLWWFAMAPQGNDFSNPAFIRFDTNTGTVKDALFINYESGNQPITVVGSSFYVIPVYNPTTDEVYVNAYFSQYTSNHYLYNDEEVVLDAVTGALKRTVRALSAQTTNSPYGAFGTIVDTTNNYAWSFDPKPAAGSLKINYASLETGTASLSQSWANSVYTPKMIYLQAQNELVVFDTDSTTYTPRLTRLNATTLAIILQVTLTDDRLNGDVNYGANIAEQVGYLPWTDEIILAPTYYKNNDNTAAIYTSAVWAFSRSTLTFTRMPVPENDTQWAIDMFAVDTKGGIFVHYYTYTGTDSYAESRTQDGPSS